MFQFVVSKLQLMLSNDFDTKSDMYINDDFEK